ncbi:MAG: hypothetical protein Ct9H300mP9_7060 [Candidatus Neomarinimicrobiota bacterium]|nr:MAG: hypothetical protein Ct9H300mP9_7060 [Candidatus Neomarinimicrobiota bacterium]
MVDSTGLSFNRFKTEKTKYDEYLIDRSNGLYRFTGTLLLTLPLVLLLFTALPPPLVVQLAKVRLQKNKRDEYVISNNVNFIQWEKSERTDGLFRNMDVDPQN